MKIESSVFPIFCKILIFPFTLQIPEVKMVKSITRSLVCYCTETVPAVDIISLTADHLQSAPAPVLARCYQQGRPLTSSTDRSDTTSSPFRLLLMRENNFLHISPSFSLPVWYANMNNGRIKLRTQKEIKLSSGPSEWDWAAEQSSIISVQVCIDISTVPVSRDTEQ